MIRRKYIIYLLFVLANIISSTNAFADRNTKSDTPKVGADNAKKSKTVISNNILYICSYNTDSRSTAEALDENIAQMVPL